MAKEKPHAPTNKASLATAKVVPVFLTLCVAYASYVVVGPLSIEYLINNKENPRVAAGIAIPIVWFFLLLPVAVAWFRLLSITVGSPGYVPLGEHLAMPDDPPPVEFWMRDVFVCDTKGLPRWCVHCGNWKPDRAHHNQDTGRCTLMMDHFCPWVWTSPFHFHIRGPPWICPLRKPRLGSYLACHVLTFT